jgi:hypothetical protein
VTTSVFASIAAVIIAQLFKLHTRPQPPRPAPGYGGKLGEPDRLTNAEAAAVRKIATDVQVIDPSHVEVLTASDGPFFPRRRR